MLLLCCSPKFGVFSIANTFCLLAQKLNLFKLIASISPAVANNRPLSLSEVRLDVVSSAGEFDMDEYLLNFDTQNLYQYLDCSLSMEIRGLLPLKLSLKARQRS